MTIEVPPSPFLECSLGEVALTSSGGTPSTKTSAYYGGDIPWAAIGDLNDGVVTSTQKTITKAGLDNSSAKILPAGTLLVAMYGSIGKMGVLGMDAATNQAICAIRPTEAVSRDFLWWNLYSRRQELVEMGRGGAQPNIGQGDIRSLSVPVPPLDEQQGIVDEIERLFAQSRRTATSLRNALRDIVLFEASVLHDAFDPRDENSDLRPGWRLSTLGDESAKSQYGWTTKASSSGAVRFLRTTDITRGPIQWDSVPYCSQAPADLPKYLLRSGDIVISRAGSVGFSALIEEVGNAVFASYLIRFRPLDDEAARYIAWYLKSPQYWAAIGAEAVGIAVQNVNAKKLADVPLPLAPAVERDRIVAEVEDRLARARAAADSLRAALDNVQRFEAAVLRDAFAGRLVSSEQAGGRESETVPLSGKSDEVDGVLA